ncbi:glycosyltransferase family 4 protein [Paracoccus onubensis]|uniref:glycosyltransferase family 4 protein n=1 Tax=Paracoccus onubensis TaxID=1675788 RepID=UPI00272F97DE|nr:glycosyltransferase family 4 protein [Paracoccus onubensis]MDP0929603.1 glycosyltransferase family 4 protein [Paracoccus onubensis]
MKILFVHQNFPGQFPHLAPALADRGHEVLALTDANNQRLSPVRTVRYKEPNRIQTDGVLGRAYSVNAERGLMAARGARALRDDHGFTPDVIIGHSGWGETLFLKEIWPEAKLLIYAELMYRTTGADVGFDPEMSPENLEGRLMTVARSAHLIQGIVQADAAIAPTRYQADSFPPELRRKISVIHDGINTQRVRPSPDARLILPNGRELRTGDEVLSFVSRSLEPYRGFHVFMRALPDVLAQRPDAQVVLVGGDGVSYGKPPEDGRNWKDVMLEEIGGRLDPDRLHFVGRLPYGQYLSLMQLARVHCYLTYPFVLSWSLTEAMSAGAYIVASDTEPVREVIRDGENGRLVPFFDQAALSAAIIRGLEGDPEADRLKRAARQTICDSYDLHLHCLPRQIEWVEGFDPAR